MARNYRVINPILTSHARGVAKQGEMVAESIAPTVMVDQYGGQVLEYGVEQFIPVDDSRMPGSNTARIHPPEYKGQDFNLKLHSLEGKVPIEHMDDAAMVPGIDLQRNATAEVTARMGLNREIEVAALVTNPANLPASNVNVLGAGARFDDAGSDPFTIIQDGSSTLRARTGMYANLLTVSPLGFEALQNHPSIRENYKYTSPNSITLEMIRNYFNLPRMQIGNAIRWDAQNQVMIDVWGKFALLTYSAIGQFGNSMENAEPSFAYTYTKRGHPMVEAGYYDNNRKTWFYPQTWNRVSVISGQLAGFLIADVVN